jgi:protein-tyrosine phosphatase
VHCFAGKSRSASIVIAYIMQLNNWQFSKAFEYVYEKRDVIDPNFGFCAQLINYEKQIIEKKAG